MRCRLQKPHHFAPRRDTRDAVAEVDGCPHRNREILATLPGNAVKVELDRLVLTRTGFRYEYHTGTCLNKEGKTYRLVDDCAWVNFSDQKILVVRKKAKGGEAGTGTWGRVRPKQNLPEINNGLILGYLPLQPTIFLHPFTQNTRAFMATTAHLQEDTIRRYYKIHAAIYDATRWTFLLGRRSVLRHLPMADGRIKTLLEIGCGTGYNLRQLARKHARLQLIGVDVSSEMLIKAAQNTRKYTNNVLLVNKSYQSGGYRPENAPDVILFSYALTMFNPGWEEAILCAKEDLPTGGRIVLVDFHNTAFRWFSTWMGHNHVRMDGHLLPFLQHQFSTEYVAVKKAYLGLWQYVEFIGVKNG